MDKEEERSDGNMINSTNFQNQLTSWEWELDGGEGVGVLRTDRWIILLILCLDAIWKFSLVFELLILFNKFKSTGPVS